MDRVKVKDIKNGTKMASKFMVISKRLTPFKGKTGNFLTLVLGDSSGQMEAKIWDRADEASGSIRVGDLLEVKAEVRDYNGSLQLNVLAYRVCPDEEYSSKEFLPVSPRNIGEMLAELTEIIDSIQNPHLKKLLFSFFNDEQWLKRFTTAPAAKINHQAYLGGLLEHSLNITKASLKMVCLYPMLDRDLMITGAVLHDIGKIEEYTYNRTIDITDEGRFLGHIIIGVNQVERRISELGENFPPQLRLKVLHMITSHHGQYEWQSPKRPKILEAAVIHILDNLDTVVDVFSRIKDDSSEDVSWSSWIPGLERKIYLK